MLGLLKSLFERRMDPAAASAGGAMRPFELAGAALMVELMRSDQQLDPREQDEFIRVLRQTFGLEQHDIEEIRTLAARQAEDATSLFEFTRLVNDHYCYKDKVTLIENLWRLAFADQRLDKYEEGLIRRVADLIHVSHGDFIQAKLKVRGSRS